MLSSAACKCVSNGRLLPAVVSADVILRFASSTSNNKQIAASRWKRRQRRREREILGEAAANDERDDEILQGKSVDMPNEVPIRSSTPRKQYFHPTLLSQSWTRQAIPASEHEQMIAVWSSLQSARSSDQDGRKSRGRERQVDPDAVVSSNTSPIDEAKKEAQVKMDEFTGLTLSDAVKIVDASVDSGSLLSDYSSGSPEDPLSSRSESDEKPITSASAGITNDKSRQRPWWMSVQGASSS